MNDPDELITWLRAQLDEDERVAHAAGGPDWVYRSLDDRFALQTDHVLLTSERVIDATGGEGELTPDEAEHIARHDPARVLAEVAAKRALIDRYERQHYHGLSVPDSPYPQLRAEETGACRSCVTLRLLAQPYAGRPGWREEWKS